MFPLGHIPAPVDTHRDATPTSGQSEAHMAEVFLKILCSINSLCFTMIMKSAPRYREVLIFTRGTPLIGCGTDECPSLIASSESRIWSRGPRNVFLGF